MPISRYSLKQYYVYLQSVNNPDPDKKLHLSDVLISAEAPASYFEQIEKIPNEVPGELRSIQDKATKGPMKEETREMLRKFYLPFNERLVDILKDKQFAYES